jgi:hypothetical protein
MINESRAVHGMRIERGTKVLGENLLHSSLNCDQFTMFIKNSQVFAHKTVNWSQLNYYAAVFKVICEEKTVLYTGKSDIINIFLHTKNVW